MDTSLIKPIQDAFQLGLNTLNSFVQEPKNLAQIEQMAKELVKTFEAGGKVLSCGNGGSACDALHFSEEFTGQFRKKRIPLPALSLTESAHITCVANDFGFEEIFARGVQAYGKAGDVLIALSTSGNSENVIRAVKMAREQGLKTFLFLGKDGGTLKSKGDFEVIVEALTSDRIQEVHMMCLHILIEMVERLMFPNNYK